MPGPERNAAGKPYVSAELITLINVPASRRQDLLERPGPRHVADRASRSGPGVKIVDGRMFTSGTNEAIVSKNLSKRFASMKVGDTLKTGSFRWVIVGLFDAQGSAYESEIWTDVVGSPAADEARHLLLGLRAPARLRTRPAGTSRPSRATSA